MKKLVYILSLAIGLLMTGCAQWENFESLSPDTWGAEPELTVTAPDSITTEVITFTIATKNATNYSYAVYAQKVDMDYTLLLQGLYNGCQGGEIDPEGFEKTISLKCAVPGNTYYLYVVAANAAGVQATYEKAMGAHDLDAPFLTSDPALTASNKGTRVTLSFNEAIVRTDAMGAITFDIYNEDLEVVREGVATAVASSNQLTVTLPADVTFETVSYVLLSFEEGAVEDKYGNKMAAINNYLEDGLPNGPWWMYDPNDKPVVEDGFLKDGGQYFYYGTSTSISQDGSEQEVGTDFITLSLTQAGVDMSQIFNGMTTGDLWSIPSIFNMFTPESGIESVSVPAYSYDYEQNTYFTMVNTQDKQWLTPCGSVPNVGTCYLGDVTDEGNLYPYWDFVLLEQQGQEMLQYAGNRPVIFFFQEDGSPALILDFTSLYIFDEGALGASVTYYETPVVLENAKLVKPQDIKKFNFVEKY